MNADEINGHLREALARHFGDKRDELLCTMCGYPSCSCSRCKGKAHLKHRCWLQSRGTGKKSKRWISESDAQLRERTDAWLTLGITAPVFRGGAFVFE